MKKISFLVVLLLGLCGCDNSSNKGTEANGSYDSSMTPDDGRTDPAGGDTLASDSTDSLQRQPSPAKPE
ncbi:hypothetical protein [Sphingobacterium puteale]|uniref:hypothetical protein n=1 Tax=Sphingobacterium puteale TaxID=2420510 RepID=UPI003D9987C0